MAASLLKSPGLYSIFWPISIMQLFGWSPLVLLFPSSPVTFTNPLVTVPRAAIKIDKIDTFMSPSFFFIPKQSRGTYTFFPLSFNFTLWSAGISKSTVLQVLFIFLLIIVRSGRLDEIRWSVCLNSRGVRMSHSPGQMLGCAYTICSYG